MVLGLKMSQSHLRRNSKASFFLDLENSPSNDFDEKNILDEVDEEKDLRGGLRHKKEFINFLLSVILFLLIIATFFNLFFFKTSYNNHPSPTNILVSNEEQLQHYELLDDVYTDDIDNHIEQDDTDAIESSKHFLKSFWDFIKFELNTSKTEIIVDSHLIDIDFIPFQNEATEELWKLDDQNQYLNYQQEQTKEKQKLDQQQREKEQQVYTDESDETEEAQKHLKEILSVSPITLLINSNQDDINSKESQVLRILSKSMTITPEPMVVNLIKHPHYIEIYNYLKNYHHHEMVASTTTTSTPSVKDDVVYFTQKMKLVNVDLNADVETTMYDDDVINNLLNESEGDEDDCIPRLFIGGKPIGNYDQIINLHSEGELFEFLKNQGEGLINVSL